MTNVPQRVRDLWSEIYVLFDRNYRMENTVENWKTFWDQAQMITSKYSDCEHVMKMVDLVSILIEDRMKRENKVREE